MLSIRYPLFVFILVLGLLASACERKPADNSKVLATVNDEVITENVYQHYLSLRQSRQGPIANKKKEKEIVLNELIDRILLSQYALDNKIDQDPEVYMLIKRVRENILVQTMIRKVLSENPISKEDIKKRFEQEVKNTHKTEYKVRHILVNSEDEGNKIIKRLRRGAGFAALAKQKSADVQSGKRGGDLGWINQDMVVPEFFNAMITMKKGGISKTPVKSEFGWHIIRVDNKRPLKIPTFEKFMADKRAIANLQRRIQDERISALINELKQKAKITVK